jgi:hypothetical protein
MANQDPVETAKDILERVNKKVEDMNNEVNEAEVVLDVDDNQAADGKEATATPKGKKKMKRGKTKPSDASAKIDKPSMDEKTESLVDEWLDEGLTDEEILDRLSELADDDGDESDTIGTDAKAGLLKLRKAKLKASYNYGMEEHVDALFQGEDLTEEFRNKATTIFEAAVKERVEAITESMQEEFDNKIEESVESHKSDLSRKLDDYLGYVVEEWMKDNELAIELGIKTEIAESFLTGLHGLFEEHYITVPDSKTDILEEMVSKVGELEDNLNASLEKNVELRRSIIESRCDNVFHDLSRGLVEVDVAKLKALSEGLEYDNENQYAEKLSVLRESYFSDNDVIITEDEDVDENTDSEATPQTSSIMESYTDAISKQVKNR